VFAGNGLLANDPAGTAIVAADAVSGAGGSVAVDAATGAFTYDPPVGLENATDTFTYRAPGFPAATVTVTLRERVWYVRNDAAGADQGNDRAPFRTLAQAELASGEDDVIFVFAGDVTSPTDAGQDRGIVLKPGQRLLGEGVGLRLDGFPIVDPFPPARISNRAAAGDAPVVRLATRNEVAGFEIEAASNEALLGIGGEGHRLHDNVVTFDPGAGRDGIRLLNAGGDHVVVRNTIVGSPRSGIAVANDEDRGGDPAPATSVAGRITIARNVVTGSAHDGISVHLDGAGTDVALDVLTNTVSGSGTGGGGAAIEVSVRGAAAVRAVLSRNVAAGSAAGAIDMVASGAASLAAFAAGNALSASGGAFPDFRTAVPAGSVATACLELIGNRNGAGSSTFRVENAGGALRMFEPDAASSVANDTAAARLGQIDDAPEGACAVPLDGAALFEANCGHCHRGNGLGRGDVARDVTGTTAERIEFQLANNPFMSPPTNPLRLTPQEIQAIVGALAPAQ
jgi:mono/diheme cytochrome c family protein